MLLCLANDTIIWASLVGTYCYFFMLLTKVLTLRCQSSMRKQATMTHKTETATRAVL